jgi:hypothetical protein
MSEGDVVVPEREGNAYGATMLDFIGQYMKQR